MNFDQQLDDGGSPVNMTSLVDVVFILLSFFVLTAKFGHERDVMIGAEPPMQAGAAVQSSDLPERVVIRLTPGGTAESLRIVIGQTAVTDVSSITVKLTEISLPAVPVVLAADERVRIDQLAQAMDAVLASPMKRLSLSGLTEGSSWR